MLIRVGLADFNDNITTTQEEEDETESDRVRASVVPLSSICFLAWIRMERETPNENFPLCLYWRERFQ